MRKNKNVVSAKFYRKPFAHTALIEVTIQGASEPISLFHDIIEYCAKTLSEIELEEVISILSHTKDVLLKRRNFPPIYEEMLSDLIKVQKERYGGKKERPPQRSYMGQLNGYEIEQLIKDRYSFETVHIDRILAGDNRDSAKWVELGLKDPTLSVHYTYKIKREEQ